MIRIFVIVLLFSLNCPAQNYKSVHQIENEYHAINSPPTAEIIRSTQHFMIKSTVPQTPVKTVFGYLPWWEYSSGSAGSLRYDLLTHVAVAFFETDSAGGIKDPPLWPWNDLILNANNNNVKLIMALSNFEPAQIHNLLTDPVSRQKLFDSIIEKIKNYGFDGVNIDFENLNIPDRGFILNNFMKSLSDSIKSQYPLSEISFASPAVNSGGWDFTGLSNSCDYLFLMGYDYYGSWSNTTGPSAPLTGTNFNLTYSLNQYYAAVPAEKIIFGVPYYGNYWRTDSSNAYTSVVPYDSNRTDNNWIAPLLTYKQIAPLAASKERMWDDNSGTPWLRWYDSKWNQIWYDDAVSLSLKYDLAISKKLKGIGIWALGYDKGKTELWNLIETKFITAVEEDHFAMPIDFHLNQNYPNPFNPETVIGYRLPVACMVSLRVYDLLGREVAVLVDMEQEAGIYNSKFIIHNSKLPSGVYFYRLSAGTFSVTKKMILVR